MTKISSLHVAERKSWHRAFTAYFIKKSAPKAEIMLTLACTL